MLIIVVDGITFKHVQALDKELTAARSSPRLRRVASGEPTSVVVGLLVSSSSSLSSLLLSLPSSVPLLGSIRLRTLRLSSVPWTMSTSFEIIIHADASAESVVIGGGDSVVVMLFEVLFV